MTRHERKSIERAIADLRRRRDSHPEELEFLDAQIAMLVDELVSA